MYLRDTDSDEQTDNVSSEKNISTLDVVAAIMEMDVPMEIRWKIQDIFVHWKSHLEKALPLLNYAYQTLIDFEPQLELYAQNFISYWTNEITNQGGIVPFAEHLFPLNNLPDNPFGYKLYISFSCLLNLVSTQIYLQKIKFYLPLMKSFLEFYMENM